MLVCDAADDERGGSNQMLLGPCFSVTLNDKREGFHHGRMTLHEKKGGFMKCCWGYAFV